MLHRSWLASFSICAAMLAAAGRAEPVPTNRAVFPDALRRQFRDALNCMNMTDSDPGFGKDYAEPKLVFPVCREALKNPLLLTDMAQTALRVSGAGLDADAWRQVCEWSAVEAPGISPVQGSSGWLDGGTWPAGMADMLNRFYSAAGKASALLDRAFTDLSADEREAIAAEHLAELLNVEEDPVARADLTGAGISSQCVQRAVLSGRELDGKPAAARFLDRVGKIRRADLFAAAAVLSEAAARLAEEAETVTVWPAAPVQVLTPLGVVRIGTTNSDAYSSADLLVLDPGGGDGYAGPAGAANAFLGRPLAVVVDLGGDDRYVSEGLCGAGGALFGISILLDRQGDDRYECRYSGQGAGLFGAGWLRDDAGDDEYRSGIMGQAAAFVGAGMLQDAGGNDTYQAGVYAQGFGGAAGVGWLCDRSGHDRYFVGGREPDYDRHAHRFVAFGQGTALGRRPGAGGGIGILADLAGNDVYIADVYGQGVGYWYAAGMLLDVAGHDSYQVYEYGQGTGIHLSSGLLYDGAGNDIYNGFSLSQGSAHDFAVGVLLDAEGDDTYTADHFSQGRAINNSFALLADEKGKDAYFARINGECQGRGQWNPERGFGGVSMLMDLAGDDQYSGGATNGVISLDQHDGIVYDLRDPPTGAESSQVAKQEYDTNARIEWVGGAFDPSAATFDNLMFHASRYGCTEQRRRNKEIAWREIKARGKDALRYLTANSGRENIWYSLYARRMTEELQPGDAAEVLLEFAHHESAEVRKMAVFLLGFCGTPQHAPLIRPLLADADARGAAARTLGKWKDRASVTGIVECLHDAQDRRRAQAATALGDIGDPSAVSALIEALGDPVGVVREAARRALTHLPAAAAGPTLKSRLPSASGVCAREIIRCLGLLRFRPAFKELGRIALNSEDPWLRGEAVRALKRIDAARAEGVLKSLRKTETHPFVRSCLDPSPDAMR